VVVLWFHKRARHALPLRKRYPIYPFLVVPLTLQPLPEIELSVFGRECFNRRIPDVAALKREVAALEAERNAHESTAHWRFTTADARIKLRRLYPSYSE
jgi:hypothetical protein